MAVVVGIVAKTKGRAEAARKALGISSDESVLLYSADQARGCALSAVVWVGHVDEKVVQAVEPALVNATMEAQAWQR